MLATFRRARQSWIVVGLLGLVMLAFIITGRGTPGDFGSLGGSRDHVATIGDDGVTTAEVEEALRRQLDTIRQENPEVDMGELIRRGLFDEAVTQMTTLKALTIFGADAGLAVSERMIDGAIASIPAFHNAAGRFDETTFRAALARVRMNEDALREDFRSQMTQRQLLEPIMMASRVPDGLARQYAALLLESRTGSIGLVPAQAMTAGPAPTDAQVSAFYQRNQARYTVPERRVLRYALFGRNDVAVAAQPTETEIAAFYRENAARFGPRESRAISQVVLFDERAAQTFAAKVKAGTSFAKAAADAGFSDKDIALGPQTREGLARIASPSVAAAAFGAAQGAVTAPIRSPLGWHIIRVDAINQAPARTIDAVRPEITARLAAQKAEDALNTLVSRIEDSISDGASFEEVVGANKLPARETPAITAAGNNPDDANLRLPAEVSALVKPGFEMGADDDPEVATIAAGQQFALLKVGRLIPAAPPPLAQIRERVVADLVRERAFDEAKALAERLARQVTSGTAMGQAFAKSGVNLPAIQAVKFKRLDVAAGGDKVPEPVRLMFNIPKGKARALAVPNAAGWFVVQVSEIIPGNVTNAAAQVDVTRTQLSEVLGLEYAEQFGRAVERDIEIERNEETIARLKKQLQSNNAAP